MLGVARADLFFQKLEKSWQVLFKLIEKVLDMCWCGKEPWEIREAMDAIDRNPVEARAKVLEYGRALWKASEAQWEWNVVGVTEKAMQLPRQEIEEEEDEELEQWQSRGTGLGR